MQDILLGMKLAQSRDYFCPECIGLIPFQGRTVKFTLFIDLSGKPVYLIFYIYIHAGNVRILRADSLFIHFSNKSFHFSCKYKGSHQERIF
jgi:hypothetical protein